MPMAVMQIRPVRMRMGQSVVPVLVGMFAGLSPLVMIVMGVVVGVKMLVLDSIVLVEVRMALRDVKGNS